MSSVTTGYWLYITYFDQRIINTYNSGGCRVRDRMVVGFTTTYAISAYHH
jgi:hypothetical protein